MTKKMILKMVLVALEDMDVHELETVREKLDELDNKVESRGGKHPPPPGGG